MTPNEGRATARLFLFWLSLSLTGVSGIPELARTKIRHRRPKCSVPPLTLLYVPKSLFTPVSIKRQGYDRRQAFCQRYPDAGGIPHSSLYVNERALLVIAKTQLNLPINLSSTSRNSHCRPRTCAKELRLSFKSSASSRIDLRGAGHLCASGRRSIIHDDHR